MKIIKEKLKSEKLELKGPSLTIKWAFASSFFIFVVFTIFAVITYNLSINLLVQKERKNIEKTISQVTERLSRADSQLTTSMIYTLFSETDDQITSNNTIKIDGNHLVIDPFLAELGSASLFLYIYDLEEELIFKSQEDEQSLIQTNTKEPTIVTIGHTVGFLSVSPVYAETNNQPIGYIQIFYELSTFYDIRSRLLLTLIVLEIVSLILSSFLGFLLSAYFLKPLKILRDTMETIRKDPQSDAHMPLIQTNDELADLAAIFNEMLDRMRLYIELQEQFVEDVSHELRTPVAIIEGHLNLLNRWGKDDPEILEESLDASMQEITRMKSLVQEMLDLSRAEQVDVHYANEVTQAKQVTHQVYNNFKLLYPDFVITLDDDLHSETLIKMYRNHFEQVIIIILDNAIKYSTHRKELHISISTTGREFEIAIQDFGEGISEIDLKRIFNRFYRVDKARARNKGGNGLGLSIAKQLVESYKGRILAESVLGQGTIFRIFLPIVKNDES